MSTKQNELKYTLNSGIRQLRKHLGMSQEEMGRVLGVKRSSYGKIERGESYPSARMLYILAAKYNVSLDYLVCGRGTLFNETKLTGQKSGAVSPLTLTNEEAELLNLMREVPLVQYSVMSFFQRFKIENKALIESELADTAKEET